MKNLKYSELTMQPYLITNKLSIPEKKLIYKLRNRMINTPENMGKHQQCQLCGVLRDEMSHALVCVVVKLACPSLVYIGNTTIQDAHGDDIDRMKLLAVHFKKAWMTRQFLLGR